MITMAQSELPDEPGLLRRLGGDEPLFGVYAEVLSPGRIKPGDPVLFS
jgi:MOSC domain-containing protein YiiM